MIRLKSEQGSALLAILAIFLALAILGVAMVAATGGESRSTARNVSSSQALALADAGVERAFSEIMAKGPGSLSDGLENSFDMGTGKAEYNLTVKSVKEPGLIGSWIVSVISTGTVTGPDYRRTVEGTFFYGPHPSLIASIGSLSEDNEAIKFGGKGTQYAIITGPIAAKGGINQGQAQIECTHCRDSEDSQDCEYCVDEWSKTIDDPFDELWKKLEEWEDHLPTADGEDAGEMAVVDYEKKENGEFVYDEDGEPVPIMGYVVDFETWEAVVNGEDVLVHDSDEVYSQENIGVVIYGDIGENDKFKPETGDFCGIAYPRHFWVRSEGPPGNLSIHFDEVKVTGGEAEAEADYHPTFYAEGDIIVTGESDIQAHLFSKGNIRVGGDATVDGWLWAKGTIRVDGTAAAGKDTENPFVRPEFMGWHRLGWKETGQHIGHQPD